MKRIIIWLIRWELVINLATVALLVAAGFVVGVLFPGINNLWVSVLVLASALTAAVASTISVLRERYTP